MWWAAWIRKLKQVQSKDFQMKKSDNEALIHMLGIFDIHDY